MYTLSYLTLDEVLIDAKHFVFNRAESTGGLTVSQSIMHIAIILEHSTEGFEDLMPWYLRAVGNCYAKPRWLVEGIPRGLVLPRKTEQGLLPTRDVAPEESLWSLETAIAKFRATEEVFPHPFLGELTKDEWEQFHLRHAELLFGYVKIDELPALAVG